MKEKEGKEKKRVREGNESEINGKGGEIIAKEINKGKERGNKGKERGYKGKEK